MKQKKEASENEYFSNESENGKLKKLLYRNKSK